VSGTATTDAAAGLRVSGVRKSFGSTQALRRLDLFAPAGQITGIAGPNGAGKSTFVGILAGELSADAGTIEIGGRPLEIGVKTDRVALVHQEPQLFPNLSVWENVMVGREHSRWMHPHLPGRVAALLEEFALTDCRDAELAMVPLAAQQRVEIVRALAWSAEVLVFDEPNSALSESESLELFASMHRLAAEGRIVLLVSHRIGELVEHCASVVTILDGEDREVIAGSALTEQALARALIDQSADHDGDERRTGALHDQSLPGLVISASRQVEGVDPSVRVDLRRGEVTAFVGVEGSGARAFVQALGAPDPRQRLRAAGGSAAGPAALVEFVSAHRQESLFRNLSVAENIASRLGAEITGSAGVLSSRRVGAVVEKARLGMRIKAGAMHDPIATLSGGNQQKVAIAAAIAKNPDLLVLEEPTRGVDIGSRTEIYRILTEYAAAGRAVCLYCTEIVEVFRAAHRALVFKEGRLAADLEVAGFADVRELSRRIVEAEWN
jgi:ABC-type sugar transport system ATPase subunit